MPSRWKGISFCCSLSGSRPKRSLSLACWRAACRETCAVQDSCVCCCNNLAVTTLLRLTEVMPSLACLQTCILHT